jgi:hypothetical protein
VDSRDRLLAALECEPCDRVPVSTYELVGFETRAFFAADPSYARLMDAIREKTDCIYMWGLRSNETFVATSHPAGMDVTKRRDGDATVTEAAVRTPRGDLRQVSKVIDHIHTTWKVEHWCKSVGDVDRAMSVPFAPVDYDASGFEPLRARLGGRGIICESVADPLCIAADLMAFGDYTVWAMTEREHFTRTLDEIHERNMENIRRLLSTHVADCYRICGPEYATPPYLPPELFRRYVTPYVTGIVELIHSKGANARLHCHGRIGRVLDDILATGCDSLDPCEEPPDGDIALAELKRRTAGKLCLLGPTEVKLLEQGSGDEVERHVRACMDAAKAGGGYILMPTAAPYGTPLPRKTEENYLRYIDAGVKYGKY